MGARFSAPLQTRPGAYPASCTMGTGSFPGVKRPGCGADHPPPSKCPGQERVGLYLYCPSGHSWPVVGAPKYSRIVIWTLQCVLVLPSVTRLRTAGKVTNKAHDICLEVPCFEYCIILSKTFDVCLQHS